MKRLLAASIAIAALIQGSAMAADMSPSKTKPAKEPPFVVYNWTGLYIGVQGGGGWGPANQTDITGFSSGTYTITGGLIGGTLGYNFQVGYAVLGLETDWSYSWVKDGTIGTDPIFGQCGGAIPRCESRLKSPATFRARIGAAMDNVMPYVTGGLAVASLYAQEGDVPVNGRAAGLGLTAAGLGSTSVRGWTAGVGIEAMFGPHWSAKMEYLYADFGNRAVFDDNVGGVIVPEHVKFTANILRVGVNYRFGY